MDPLTLWRRYKDYLVSADSLGLSLDISRMSFDDGFFARMEPAMQQAYEAMQTLEDGAIANPDENRQVGHYWLRQPNLAPDDKTRIDIENTLRDVLMFASQVHSGEIKPPTAPKYTDVLLIGIGGSALGPQLVSDALGSKKDELQLNFMDNTDPDGIDRVLTGLGSRLKSTLVLVISKSGSTPETRNGMLETADFFKRKGLDFAKQTIAITMAGSRLDQQAQSEGWIKTFPMWDFVGGRTSVMSAVGLVPMALQGLDIQSMIEGAQQMDSLTRQKDTRKNPAAVLALMWHQATDGRGSKDMVILPYKDRLLLFSRYLQQLIMESLGKELDLAGQSVNQGISVYGNKGSTDQHAYVQQLREGVSNFFVTFLVVLQDRSIQSAKTAPTVDDSIENGGMSGDYLNGFWQGTRQALYEKGRSSMTLTVQTLDARTLGALIALYERAVGFYASLVNINAYHQPGVEAGKKAAAEVLKVQSAAVKFLKDQTPQAFSAEQIADKMAMPQQAETIYHVLEHLTANKRNIANVRGKYRFKP